MPQPTPALVLYATAWVHHSAIDQFNVVLFPKLLPTFIAGTSSMSTVSLRHFRDAVMH
jgi:hypothetical protein